MEMIIYETLYPYNINCIFADIFRIVTNNYKILLISQKYTQQSIWKMWSKLIIIWTQNQFWWLHINHPIF